MIGGMSRGEKQAYRSFFSYRRFYDEASFVGLAVIITLWLLIIGGYTAALVGICLILGIVSELWGRDAMWHRLPASVRQSLPKEPLDAKAIPAAIGGYRDLYRTWVGASSRDTSR